MITKTYNVITLAIKRGEYLSESEYWTITMVMMTVL